MHGRRRRQATKVATLAAALVTAACSSSPLFAQGVDEVLPDPLSSQELARICRRHLGQPEDNRLVIPASEWVTIHTLHADYLEWVREWRSGEVERLRAERVRELGPTIDPSDGEALNRHARRAQRALAALGEREDALFNDIRATLDEARAADADAMRHARTFTRSAETLICSGRSPQGEGDLGAAMLDFPWSMETRAKVVPIARTLIERSASTFQAVTDDALRSEFASFVAREGGDAALGAVRRAQADVQRLQLAALAELAAAAPWDEVRLFRVAWVSERYSMLNPHDLSIDRAARLALRLTALDEADRAAIREVYKAYAAEDDALVARGMKALDQAHLDAEPYRGGAGDTDDAREVRDARAALAKRTSSRLAELVGDERLERLLKRHWNTDLSAKAALSPDDPPEVNLDAVRARGGRGADRILSEFPPLSTDTIAALADACNAETTVRAALAAAHATYLEHWNANIVPAARALRAEMRAFGRDPAGATPAVDEGAFPKVRLAMLDADDALFAEVAAILGEGCEVPIGFARVDRVASLGRARSMRMMAIVAEYEIPWRVSWVLRQCGLDPEIESAVKTVIASKAGEVCAAARTQTGARPVGAIENPFGLDTPPDVRELVVAMRRCLAAALSALPEEARARFEAAAITDSCDALEDPSSAQRAIVETLALPTLSEEERQGLLAVRRTYDARLLELSRAMSPLAQEPAGNEEPADETERRLDVHRRFSQWQQRRIRAAFERAELNAHLITQIRAVLADSHEAELPILDLYDVRLHAPPLRLP